MGPPGQKGEYGFPGRPVSTLIGLVYIQYRFKVTVFNIVSLQVLIFIWPIIIVHHYNLYIFIFHYFASVFLNCCFFLNLVPKCFFYICPFLLGPPWFPW